MDPHLHRHAGGQRLALALAGKPSRPPSIARTVPWASWGPSGQSCGLVLEFLRCLAS
jgi:hypothetical protein